MSYQINLTTRDGQQISFSCEQTQTVQDGAEAAGFFLPALCKWGSCGSCLAVAVAGDYKLEGYSDALLSEAGKLKGDVLLCRTFPLSDLAITAPYNADQIRSGAQPVRQADIVVIEKVAERTMRLVLQLLPDDLQGMAFEFEPGQFVDLETTEPVIRRAYSLANNANWEGQLEFFIRLQPNGQFSAYLQRAKVGERLHVHGPSGTFGVQQQSLNPRCFVAGGTGLAPFLAILRRMADWGEDHPTTLFLGVNNEQEIFCQAELTALAAAIPQLTVEICVWKASQQWQGFVGTPADALQIHLKNAPVLPDVFLCGPPQLVEAAIEIAHRAGIGDERIFCEKFA